MATNMSNENAIELAATLLNAELRERDKERAVKQASAARVTVSQMLRATLLLRAANGSPAAMQIARDLMDRNQEDV
jgi:hypothetical protein